LTSRLVRSGRSPTPPLPLADRSPPQSDCRRPRSRATSCGAGTMDCPGLISAAGLRPARAREPHRPRPPPSRPPTPRQSASRAETYASIVALSCRWANFSWPPSNALPGGELISSSLLRCGPPNQRLREGCNGVLVGAEQGRKRPVLSARGCGRGRDQYRSARPSSLTYAARTCNRAPAPPSFQNCSVPFMRRFIGLIRLSTTALLIGRPNRRSPG
jgi:hypothetical protein